MLSCNDIISCKKKYKYKGEKVDNVRDHDMFGFQIAEDIIDLLIRKVEKTIESPLEKNLKKGPITIQQLEEPDELTAIYPPKLLPVDEITPDYLIEEPYAEEEEDYQLPMLPMSTLSLPYEDAKIDVHERVIHWLPRDTCLVGSTSTFPSG